MTHYDAIIAIATLTLTLRFSDAWRIMAGLAMSLLLTRDSTMSEIKSVMNASAIRVSRSAKRVKDAVCDTAACVVADEVLRKTVEKITAGRTEERMPELHDAAKSRGKWVKTMKKLDKGFYDESPYQ